MLTNWKQQFDSPTVLIAVGCAILAILTFFINAKFVAPLEVRIAENEQNIKEVQKCIEEKPGEKMINLKFEALNESVGALEKAQQDNQKDTNAKFEGYRKDVQKKFDKIYDLLLEQHQ